MDGDSQSISHLLSHSAFHDGIRNDLEMHHLDMPVACGLCGQTFSLETGVNRSLQSVSICGDCKFLLLEDSVAPSHSSLRRRPYRRSSRLTYGGSDSIESLFSQQFSQMINPARHLDPEHEDRPGDVEHNLGLMQPVSSHTTPDGSRRWQRVVSDAESDGFNSDSFYGESESNVSSGTYRIAHAESDAISFSAYGGESDASVDGRTIFDTDDHLRSVERSDTDSDSDIDPMNAGAVEWNSDDYGEVGDENEWEEVSIEESSARNPETEARVDTVRRHRYVPSMRGRRNDSLEFDGRIHWRIREGRLLQIPSIITSMEESSGAPYLGNPGDYLDAQGFEEFLEHLAEVDSSRRGAPPAAASFVNNLPLLVVSEELQKPDGLACAVCKDLLKIGSQVNQLPCLHLYHPSCILPWLSTRNTCPLCRYELPTDDRDYEESMHNGSTISRMATTDIQRQIVRDDSSSILSDASEAYEAQESVEALDDVGPAGNLSHPNAERGRWLFLAAVPIVSLMGAVLVLWLGNPLMGRRFQTVQPRFQGQDLQHIHTSDQRLHNQRLRRWWWF